MSNTYLSLINKNNLVSVLKCWTLNSGCGFGVFVVFWGFFGVCVFWAFLWFWGFFGVCFWDFFVVFLMWIVIAYISQNCKGIGISSLLKYCKILSVWSWVSSWKKEVGLILVQFLFFGSQIQAALPLQKVLLLVSQDLC